MQCVIFFFLFLICSCATAPIQEAPKKAQYTAEKDTKMLAEKENEGYQPKERKEKLKLPPPRRRRDYLVPESRYIALMRAYPRGLLLMHCLKLCEQETGTSKSADGQHSWLLRCSLGRNIRDESIVQCREEAVDEDQLQKALKAR